MCETILCVIHISVVVCMNSYVWSYAGNHTNNHMYVYRSYVWNNQYAWFVHAVILCMYLYVWSYAGNHIRTIISILSYVWNNMCESYTCNHMCDHMSDNHMWVHICVSIYDQSYVGPYETRQLHLYRTPRGWKSNLNSSLVSWYFLNGDTHTTCHIYLCRCCAIE